MKSPIGLTPFQMVCGKSCHLLVELEHKVFWALKFLNFDQEKVGERRKLQMHELEEMRNQAYESSRLYKEKVKKYHAQVLITSWVVISILLISTILVVRNPQTIPTSGQNFFEYVLEFIRDVSKTQIGEEYGLWVPFIGTLFLFIFVSNWSGTLLPWKIIKLPHG